ncbi:IclR family transcriptional regulator [Pararobbsia silviterrae]|uniref:IclR family transcriptional regulator n=1 Tax=Pararobbsia silviterrae TaxID=1792498 RepID=A0A494XGK5_9BURK|nr:IclR family transcriptional regulator [Pararobbsia silviterrae]RKP47696.1 IclR family transcriptional regulator [Pararobbsia silviterrae]
MTSSTRTNSKQRVQSAETGAEVLKALAKLGPSASLSRISEYTDMAAAKVHRYLQAMIASGLAAQDKQTGRYQLGPEAVTIGLAALANIDVVGNVSDMLPELRDEIHHTCFLAVWGNHGPTIVRVVENVGQVTILTRVGAIMPLLTSATGLLFAAFLPPSERDPIARTEPQALQDQLHDPKSELSMRLERIRLDRRSAIQGLMVPGIGAMAVPIFDARMDVAAVVTVMGPEAVFDVSPDGPIATSLSNFGRAASVRLGAPS